MIKFNKPKWEHYPTHYYYDGRRQYLYKERYVRYSKCGNYLIAQDLRGALYKIYKYNREKKQFEYHLKCETFKASKQYINKINNL